MFNVTPAIFTEPDACFCPGASPVGIDAGGRIAVVHGAESDGPFRSAVLIPAPGQTNVNDLVNLDSLTTSFDPAVVPFGPAGTFTIQATFTNTSSAPVSSPVFRVTELSGGNLLLDTMAGPGGIGFLLTPDVGADGVLLPSESFTTEFVIGLQARSRFAFRVGLVGVPGP